jgi:D-glycero-D-manno-heptose 1,7-bisphosphate phosphatase
VTWAVFLDRDGVLNETVWDAADGRHESPLHAGDVALVDGAADAVRRLAEAGARLVIVSNQPAAAKGKATEAELDAVHEQVAALWADAGVRPDAWRYCRHAAGDGCACRKPLPGLLLDAAAELGIDLGASWLIGDTDADAGAGRAAGVRTILVEHPGSAHRRTGGPAPDHQVRSVAAAVEAILTNR